MGAIEPNHQYAFDSKTGFFKSLLLGKSRRYETQISWFTPFERVTYSRMEKKSWMTKLKERINPSEQAVDAMGLCSLKPSRY